MASFDKIKFNNSGAADTADTAFVIINAVQQLSSELQVAGLSMAFMAMCRHLGISTSTRRDPGRYTRWHFKFCAPSKPRYALQREGHFQH